LWESCQAGLWKVCCSIWMPTFVLKTRAKKWHMNYQCNIIYVWKLNNNFKKENVWIYLQGQKQYKRKKAAALLLQCCTRRWKVTFLPLAYCIPPSLYIMLVVKLITKCAI
jgi:hypothetical protein